MTDKPFNPSTDNNEEDSQFEGVLMDLNQLWQGPITNATWAKLGDILNDAGYENPYAPREAES